MPFNERTKASTTGIPSIRGTRATHSLIAFSNTLVRGAILSQSSSISRREDWFK